MALEDEIASLPPAGRAAYESELERLRTAEQPEAQIGPFKSPLPPFEEQPFSRGPEIVPIQPGEAPQFPPDTGFFGGLAKGFQSDISQVGEILGQVPEFGRQLGKGVVSGLGTLAAVPTDPTALRKIGRFGQELAFPSEPIDPTIAALIAGTAQPQARVPLMVAGRIGAAGKVAARGGQAVQKTRQTTTAIAKGQRVKLGPSPVAPEVLKPPPIVQAAPPPAKPPIGPQEAKLKSMFAPEPVKGMGWRGVELKVQEQINDGVIGLRRLQKDAKPFIDIDPGGELDLVNMLTRGPGAANAGATRFALTVQNMKRVAPQAVVDDVNTLLLSNHGKDILRVKGAERTLPQGIRTVEEIDAGLLAMRERLGEEGFRQTEEAARVVANLFKEERLRLHKAGFITAQEVGLWEEIYPWYNPFRYQEFADKRVASAAKPFTQTSRDVFRLTEKGTTASARPPMEVLGEQLVNNEARIQRNETAKAIIKLSQAQGLSVKKITGIRPVAVEGDKLIFRPGQVSGDTISFFEGGTRQIYEVPKWMSDEAIMLTRTINNPISSIIGSVNGISRAAFTTFSPAFVVSNMLNDSLTAFVSRGIMLPETAATLIRSLKGLKSDKIMQSFSLASGKQARFFGKNPKQVAREVGASGGQVVGDKKGIRRVISGVVNAIPKAGEAGEQAPRMAFFRRELNKNLPNWKNMTAEEIAATSQGRKAAEGAVELTINFARGGYLVKAANPFMIFLNAAMEGTKLPFRALRFNKNARIRLAGVAGGMTGLNAYNMSYPEYFDIPDELRWGSVVVMLPSKEKDVRGNPKPNYISVIPRTREWGLFLAPITYAMETMWKNSPTEFGEFTKTIIPMLSPVNQIPSPVVLQEIFQQFANYDTYWSSPIVPQEIERLPAEEQVTEWTSRTMEEIGKTVGLSPVRLQHFGQATLGGAFRSATSITDYIIDLINPREVSPEIQRMATEFDALDTKLAQTEFLAKMSLEDKEEMFKVLRRPDKKIPVISDVIRRVLPERGGQLFRTGQEIAERETGISAQQTSEAGRILGELSGVLDEEQKSDDSKVRQGLLTFGQWIDKHQRRGAEFGGALKTASIIYPSSAVAQDDPEAWSDFLTQVNTLGGATEDRRTKGEILLSAWRTIQPEELISGLMDWNTFYARRQSFKDSLSTEDKGIFELQRRASMSDLEKFYDDGLEILRPYREVPSQVWSEFPPEWEAASRQYDNDKKMDSRGAKLQLRQNPNWREILQIKRRIAREKKQMRREDPTLDFAVRLFR